MDAQWAGMQRQTDSKGVFQGLPLPCLVQQGTFDISYPTVRVMQDNHQDPSHLLGIHACVHEVRSHCLQGGRVSGSG